MQNPQIHSDCGSTVSEQLGRTKQLSWLQRNWKILTVIAIAIALIIGISFLAAFTGGATLVLLLPMAVKVIGISTSTLGLAALAGWITLGLTTIAAFGAGLFLGLKKRFFSLRANTGDDVTWKTGTRPGTEITVFYSGNMTSVPEQECLYTNSVYFTPTAATYRCQNWMPAIYAEGGTLRDPGPHAHSTDPIATGSRRPFLRMFCALKRRANKVTVEPDSNVTATADDPFCYAPKFWKMSLAQESDIQCHKRRMDAAMTLAGDASQVKVLLYGASRGAATTFTALADANKQQDEQQDDRSSLYSQVVGVILEAPFAQVQGDVESRIYFNDCIIPKIMEHKPSGITPLNQVPYFPPNIPILFVTSKKDRRVPIASTTRLAQSLAERKLNEVYLLVLEHSSHPGYVYDNQDDRRRYLQTVHAFRRKCGLAYDENLANQGEADLSTAKISLAPQKPFTNKGPRAVVYKNGAWAVGP